MHESVVAIFDRLAASAGPDYADEPRKMLDKLVTLLHDGALSTTCPVTCVPFADADDRRPHQLQPCGDIVSTLALTRSESAGTCPRCSAQASSSMPPPVSDVTLKRAAARARLDLHPVELPKEVQQGHVALGTRIGHGAEGVVDEATWTPPGKLARTVAVKRVKVPSAAHRRLALASVARAHVASRHSRHVCPVYGYYFSRTGHGVELCTLMELYPASLGGMLHDGPLPVGESLRICAAVAAGLAELHDTLHLWHLDIKPDNVLLAHSGDALLTDLGVAIQANTDVTSLPASTAGTQHFASPEQIGRRNVNAASDVYSLGCTLVFTLTKQAPPLVAPTIWPALRALAAAMLHDSPASRPSMGEVARRLNDELSLIRRAQVRWCAKPLTMLSCADACLCTSTIPCSRVCEGSKREHHICDTRSPGYRLAVLLYESTQATRWNRASRRLHASTSMSRTLTARFGQSRTGIRVIKPADLWTEQARHTRRRVTAHHACMPVPLLATCACPVCAITTYYRILLRAPSIEFAQDITSLSLCKG